MGHRVRRRWTKGKFLFNLTLWASQTQSSTFHTLLIYTILNDWKVWKVKEASFFRFFACLLEGGVVTWSFFKLKTHKSFGQDFDSGTAWNSTCRRFISHQCLKRSVEIQHEPQSCSAQWKIPTPQGHHKHPPPVLWILSRRSRHSLPVSTATLAADLLQSVGTSSLLPLALTHTRAHEH